MLDFLQQWRKQQGNWLGSTLPKAESKIYHDTLTVVEDNGKRKFNSLNLNLDSKYSEIQLEASDESSLVVNLCDMISIITTDVVKQISLNYTERQQRLDYLGEVKEYILNLGACGYSSDAWRDLFYSLSCHYAELTQSLENDLQSIMSLYSVVQNAFYQKLGEDESQNLNTSRKINSCCLVASKILANINSHITSGFKSDTLGYTLNQYAGEMPIVLKTTAIDSMVKLEILVNLSESINRVDLINIETSVIDSGFNKIISNMDEGTKNNITRGTLALDKGIYQPLFKQAVAIKQQRESFFEEFSHKQTKYSKFIDMQKTFKSSSYRMFERRTTATKAIDACLQEINDFLCQQAITSLVASDDSFEQILEPNAEVNSAKSFQDLTGELTKAITDWLDNRQEATWCQRFNFFRCGNPKKLSSRVADVNVLATVVKDFQS